MEGLPGGVHRAAVIEGAGLGCYRAAGTEAPLVDDRQRLEGKGLRGQCEARGGGEKQGSEGHCTSLVVVDVPKVQRIAREE